MLTDGTITLRALEPSDLDLVYRWENDPSLWPVGNTISPLSRHQLSEYINSYDGDIYAARQLRLMITGPSDAAPVGTLDLFDFDPANSRVSVGIFVAPSVRRSGYAAAALALASDYCLTTLNIHQLWATVPADNEASLTLFRNAGFRISGRLKSWLRIANRYRDVYILQKFL